MSDPKKPSVPPSPSIAVPVTSSGLRGKVTGVTRIGSRAGIVAIGAVALLLLAIVYGISNSGLHRSAAAASANAAVVPAGDDSIASIPGAEPAATPQPRRRAPAAGTPARTRAESVPLLPQTPPQDALQNAPAVPAIASVPQSAATQPLTDPAADRRAQRAAQAQALSEAARHAAIIVTGLASAPPAAAAAPAATAATPGTPPAVVAVTSPAPDAPSAPTAADATYDPNVYAQKAKTAFIDAQKSSVGNDYLTAPRQAPISPYEVQAGSIIPATMITGVNSDLPGTMIAQVSANVYDSKTGALLLIPAGAKLVGRYDSQVSNGQSRVLVAWQRILFPDSSFIDINGMAGADAAGYSGMTGKVDDHSAKVFRNAILFSLIGAGATLLQPRTIQTFGTVAAPSVGSQIAASAGSQISSIASQVAGKGLQQQPTIEVRPGYIFNVMVDRDLVLPGPYVRQ